MGLVKSSSGGLSCSYLTATVSVFSLIVLVIRVFLFVFSIYKFQSVTVTFLLLTILDSKISFSYRSYRVYLQKKNPRDLLEFVTVCHYDSVVVCSTHYTLLVLIDFCPV